MGVPKFYRWLSERYPKINQVITDTALLPEFDHLYMDMNGIIHGCTHPSHLDISDVLSERDMMLGIMHYLDRIITQIVKPKVSVYMAIDGVAPRAKLNQQRSRRFRSAKDMAEAAKDNQTFSTNDDTQHTPTHQLFDSNCITPGTEFLFRVSNTIKYFIRKKIKEDPLWRNLKIIFSGPEIPGEGEHKIMQHIREMKAQPGYQPNTRHCMYGQDADLIMLGLVSHEPHFTLLREIVDFSGGFNRNSNALKTVTKFTKESDFQLLHLSILREYLHLEFNHQTQTSSYDLERTIDDFVFMTFLVGNDFLPHLPSMDISDGAFDLLFNTYKIQRKSWGENEYLTNAGSITSAERLESFIAVIGEAENQIFQQREINEGEYIKKKRRWDKRDGKAQGPSDLELANEEESKQNDYVSIIEQMLQKHSLNGNFIDGWGPDTIEEGKDFKGRYYFEKLQFTPVDVEQHLHLRQAYIEGLIWCLAYYYRGCISWGWFYPYHYGPMLSDLTNLPQMFENITLEIGEPLKPFEQLMGCLPPASAILVPKSYRKLMTSPESPIIQFYPKSFDVDMNGKRNPWEGVNLLPFIDEVLLKDAISKFCPDESLTADEKNRNIIGKVFIYSYDPAINDTIPSCNRDIGLPDIVKCNSKCDTLDYRENTEIAFKPILIPGTQIPSPGFPSLNVLPMQSVELTEIGLNCFGSPSKYSTTVLSLHPLPQLPPADKLADSILGKSIFINWPMMHEAKVVAISDSTTEVRMVKKKKKIRAFSEKEVEQWNIETAQMIQHEFNGFGVPGSGGVSIGDIQIRLKVVPLQGMRTSALDGSSKKLFGKQEADVPLQMSLFKAPAPDPRFEERGPCQLQDRFPSNSNIILTKGKYRGCLGTVMEIFDDKVGIKISIIPPEPPFGLAIARSVQESYISSLDASRVLKLKPAILGKITGSLNFNPGRYDLGLNLKYKQDLCVLGYTRRKPDSDSDKAGEDGKAKKAWAAGDSLTIVANNNTDSKKGKFIWEYTPKAIRLVNAYRQKFPMLFAAIAKNPNEPYYDAKVLGSNGIQMLSQIRDWLNNIETAKLPRMPGTTQAMPYSAISAVQRASDVRVASNQKTTFKEVNLKVPPSALYCDGSTSATDVLQGSDHNENAAPELGDRIANLCANGIPFGARGTIVSIHDPTTRCVEVVMDEEFIGGSTLQGACGNFRGKLCVWNHLMKITAKESKDIIEQIIPSGSVKTVLDSMIVDNPIVESKEANGTTIKSNINTQKTAESENANQTKPSNAKSTNFNDLEKTKSSANRLYKNEVAKVATMRNPTPSRGSGGKQGAWKEAKGPDEAGIGFNRSHRSVASGLKAWRSMISPTKGPTTTGGTNTTENQSNIITSSSSSASANLKAVLGVNGSQHVEANSNESMPKPVDASAGLKALLGVGSVQSSSPDNVEHVPAPQPVTAADALLTLMAQNQHSVGAPFQTGPIVSAPKFNFSYVKEGQDNTNEPSIPQQAPLNVQYPFIHHIPGANHAPAILQSPLMMHNPNMPMGFVPHPPMPSTVQSPPTVPLKREKKINKEESEGVSLVPSVALRIKK